MSTYILSPSVTTIVNNVSMDQNGNAIAVSISGIWYSSDSGHTWTLTTTGNFVSVFMDQSVNAIAGASENGLYYSSDRGHTWTASDVTTGSFRSVFMDQCGNAIAGANDGLWYSSNYGHSWTKSLNGIFYSVFMDNLGNAIAGEDNGLWYSPDKGHGWTLTASGATFRSVFMDQSVNAIAGSNNGLWYSSNSGFNWNKSLTGSYNSVFMDQSGNAIAGSAFGKFYSSNHGINWTRCSNIGSNCLFMDQSGNAISGGNSGLEYSSNHGQTWAPTNVTSGFFSSVFMDQKGNRLASGPGIYYNLTEVVCFKEGTKILTDKGYKLIQDLRKGDLVKTVNDFIPIHAIGKREIFHPATPIRHKDQLYKCSPENFPVFEDLVITGCHSILVDEFKEGEREKTIEILKDVYITDEKYRLPACVHERTTVYETRGTYTIYHFALENDNNYYNYGVYANGLLVETCSKRYLKELSNMDLI